MTLAAFLTVALIHLMAAVSPGPAVLMTAWIGLREGLRAVVFANETVRNTAVARIFSFNRARRTYISLKSVIDRVLGGMLALLGVKIAAF